MTLRQRKSTNSLSSKLEQLMEPALAELGYELVAFDLLQKNPNGPGALLRLFIDFLEAKQEENISHEDCMRVDRGLDPLFESEAFQMLFPNEFTLEVSSPGLERPLRKLEHFAVFVDSFVKIKCFAPLSEEELENTDYAKKFPKQKSFLGKISSVLAEKIYLEIESQKIAIPFETIAKANLSIDNLNSKVNRGKIA